MTLAQTRLYEIFRIEGILIKVFEIPSEKEINYGQNGIMGPYPRKRATKNACSVSNFIKKFEEYYPGLTCNVYMEDGTKASGQKKLGAVRDSYSEDD